VQPKNPAAAAAEAVRSLALRVMQRSALHGRHACVAGCACCCHTAVTVAPPEIFAIAHYLRSTLTLDELETVRGRLNENAARAATCDRDAYIAALVPCGLLTTDGNCRAHAVRPLACAGYLSTSRAACEAEFRRDAGRAPVPTDRFTMLVGLGASHGLRAACRDAHLDGEFYELHDALRRVLDDPEAEQRWANGEAVFDGCLK
jgi:Fe-S-cluster containining protein